MDEILNFKNGIFNLHTTRFGTIGELIIQKKYNMINSNNNAYDKIYNGEKIEIKFSRALKEHTDKINIVNLIEQCLNSSSVHRWIKYDERNTNVFDCNIQQVKPNEFDWLFYGIFFQDKIVIFKIPSSSIQSIPSYSNKQHRGNIGEGQFHITNDNIEYHIKHFLVQIMTYNEIYDLFKKEA